MHDLPAVDMLWESADPGQVLTRRFGFRDGAPADEWVAYVLERYWGLDVVRCDRLVISDRNVMEGVQAGGRPLIVKWSSLPHRSANILHDGARISAVLDFEEITCDTRVVDIAKSAVLLGTRYRDWGPTSESVRAAYVNAYDRHAQDRLTTAERQEVDARVAALLKSFGWV